MEKNAVKNLLTIYIDDKVVRIEIRINIMEEYKRKMEVGGARQKG